MLHLGLKDLGYQEAEVEEVSGAHKSSGYSDKLKKMVKESLMSESYSEFQRDDKKGVDKKDKGEEEAFGAGVAKGEKIEKRKLKNLKKKQ
jgi:hypothetical protein